MSNECPVKGMCEEWYHVRNCTGGNWHECPIYDKIQDHLMEAREVEWELKETEEAEDDV